MKQWHKRTRTALSAVLLSVVLFVGTLLSGGAIPGMTAAPADYDEQEETDHEE